jgi:hypothetical protein
MRKATSAAAKVTMATPTRRSTDGGIDGSGSDSSRFLRPYAVTAR